MSFVLYKCHLIILYLIDYTYDRTCKTLVLWIAMCISVSNLVQRRPMLMSCSLDVFMPCDSSTHPGQAEEVYVDEAFTAPSRKVAFHPSNWMGWN